MPKIVDREAYRGELLARCFALFAERGFGAATMRGIASHLGVSTGTLYHYFATKDAIFAALVPVVGASIVERAVAAMQGVGQRKRKARLARFVVDNESELRDLLSIVLDARRGADAEAVVATTRMFRASIAEQLALDDEAAARLFERLLGHIVHRMLDPAAPAAPRL